MEGVPYRGLCDLRKVVPNKAPKLLLGWVIVMIEMQTEAWGQV